MAKFLKREKMVSQAELTEGIKGVCGQKTVILSENTGECETRFYLETDDTRYILPKSYAMPDLSEGLGKVLSVKVSGKEKTKKSERNIYIVELISE